MKFLPLKAATSTIYLEKVIEFGAIVYRVRERQKQVRVSRRRDGRSWGPVRSKVSDIVRETW